MVKKTRATAAQRVEVEPIFGDFGDLERVCNLLHEQAKVADAPADHPVHENGPIGLLRQRMHKQWDGQACEIEAEHPGLFDRTYLAGIYRETDAILERITLVLQPVNNETCIMLLHTYPMTRSGLCDRRNCISPTRIVS